MCVCVWRLESIEMRRFYVYNDLADPWTAKSGSTFLCLVFRRRKRSWRVCTIGTANVFGCVTDRALVPGPRWYTGGTCSMLVVKAFACTLAEVASQLFVCRSLHGECLSCWVQGPTSSEFVSLPRFDVSAM